MMILKIKFCGFKNKNIKLNWIDTNIKVQKLISEFINNA